MKISVFIPDTDTFGRHEKKNYSLEIIYFLLLLLSMCAYRLSYVFRIFVHSARTFMRLVRTTYTTFGWHSCIQSRKGTFMSMRNAFALVEVAEVNRRDIILSYFQ